MADAKGPLILTMIPIEIRHIIYEYASERDADSNELIQHWFEKKEIAQIEAQRAANQATVGNGDGEDGEDNEEMEGDDDNEDDDEDEDEGDDDDGGDGTATATATATVTVQASRKWRHIPGIMTVTHFPPPLNLLHTSKKLSSEAINWYYDVAILRIDGTSGFAHTTFFEEALQELADAAFSPAERIRRVEVTFVWDTDWLRKSEAIEDIYGAMLHQRVGVIVEVLSKAPELKEVTIKWHDSTNDDGSGLLKLDIAEKFLSLKANITLEEHYLEQGVEPSEDSHQGKRRLEFEHILLQGHQFF